MSHILIIYLHFTPKLTSILNYFFSTRCRIAHTYTYFSCGGLFFCFLYAPLHWFFLLYPSMPLLPTPQLPYSETWTHQNHRVPHKSHQDHRVPHESHHRSIRILMSTTNIINQQTVTHASSTKSTANPTWQQVLFRVLGRLREMGIPFLKPRNTPHR